MLQGGYQIVDFKDIDLTSAGVTIAGIYESIEASHKKVLLASGLVINGAEHRDAWIEPTHAENTYTIAIGDTTITVDNTDTVKVSV